MAVSGVNTWEMTLSAKNYMKAHNIKGGLCIYIYIHIYIYIFIFIERERERERERRRDINMFDVLSLRI